MANSLLDAQNQWQIRRAIILKDNPEMALTIEYLDSMVEKAVRSAIEIAHRVDWDFREAGKRAKEVAPDA
ncbi:hypothetical protein C2U55_26635 [Enterobacteriaceae bacterium ENNIH3]|nr:hypothetical protein C2U55_26635 [Enterobacteriaceae bacterium ENNIH3]AUV07570.1 hypothetical protein C2U52_15475 [Enterobacteriaceae bacterium ENNIH2]